MTPLHRLDTERLVLRASDPAHAAEVAAFYTRNRVAHAPWSPPPTPTLFTAAGQQQRLLGAAMAEADGSQVGWWLTLREAPERIVGQLRFSQVSRGPFYSAMLGYSIDSACEGRGLMHEALVAALADAGFEVVALSPRGEAELSDLTVGPRVAALFGAEGPGLPDALLARTRTVRIAMAKGFDSLNVATTSGIVLHTLNATRETLP